MDGGKKILLRKSTQPVRPVCHEVPPLHECLAKIIESNDARTTMGLDGAEGGQPFIVPGLDVETHCRIVGLVAAELLSRMSPAMRASLFPDGSELIAAAHDVGKINPHFQEKIRRALFDGKPYVPNSFPGLEDADPHIEERIGWHSGVSQVALSGLPRFIPEIVGCHHGFSPNVHQLLPDDPILGGSEWQQLRLHLIESLKNHFKKDWPKINDDMQANVIAGLTVVADWIGSGPVFESYYEQDQATLPEAVKRSVDAAGFIKPSLIEGLDFHTIFTFPPRPIQLELAGMVDAPGVYILEAPMGEGKTEAALFAAYRMMEQGLASGIYFALPTQLTSQKVYERMNLFLKTILDPSDKHRSLLLHSNNWLYHTDLGEEGRPGYSWFDTRKRGLLAPFAVGTIDQALMAVMNVKHGFVRAFGLAGKVVILDEVHTYDAYTGTILDYLIQNLRKLGCTVILLSATLTVDRKATFIGGSPAEPFNQIHQQYPLVTASKKHDSIDLSHRVDIQDHSINLFIRHDDATQIDAARQMALQGGQVLWIENTVQEAQQIFKAFAAWGEQTSVEVGLVHSRFPAIMRNHLENHWVGTYGKDAHASRSERGRILIGTQVLEQSLDIDADLLITRLAPIDMILQRTGRLWRHRSNDALRPKNVVRMTVILAPELDEALRNPKFAFGASGVVYSPYVLARTLETLSESSVIAIPSDIRSMIEATYRERIEDNRMAQVKFELLQVRQKLHNFANNSLSKVGSVESDTTLTRYSDIPSRDVLLLREDPGTHRETVILIDGSVFDLHMHEPLGLADKKNLSRILAERIITVPTHLAPKPVGANELEWLKPFLFVSPSDEERIRVAILRPDGTIEGLGNRIVNDAYSLEYSPLYGYLAIKKEVS